MASAFLSAKMTLTDFMNISQDLIFSNVLTALGESPLPGDSLPASGVNIPLEDIALDPCALVELHFPEVASRILLYADPLSHNLAVPLPGKIIPVSSSSAILPLPADFLRISSVRLSTWAVSLHDPSPPEALRIRTAPRFPRMLSPYLPLLTLEGDENGRHLRFFANRFSEDDPVVATYIPVPRWLPDRTIRFPESLLNQAVTQTAQILSRIISL